MIPFFFKRYAFGLVFSFGRFESETGGGERANVIYVIGICCESKQVIMSCYRKAGPKVLSGGLHVHLRDFWVHKG